MFLWKWQSSPHCKCTVLSSLKLILFITVYLQIMPNITHNASRLWIIGLAYWPTSVDRLFCPDWLTYRPVLTTIKPVIVPQCETQALVTGIPGLRQYTFANTHAFGCIFCVYYAIRDGPVTSSCVSHCQSLFGHTHTVHVQYKLQSFMAMK